MIDKLKIKLRRSTTSHDSNAFNENACCAPALHIDRITNGLFAGDWPEAVSGEVFQTLRECDRGDYLQRAGAALRHMEAFHAWTPKDLADRQECISRLLTATEFKQSNVFDLNVALPSFGDYLHAHSTLMELVWYAAHAMDKPLPMDLEAAEGIDGWSSACEIVDCIFDSARAEAEVLGLDLDALLGSTCSRESLLRQVS